jgi:GNAT superfamily N-acetyltransferase
MIIRRGLVTDIFELSRLWKAFVKESDQELNPNLAMWRDFVVSMMRYDGYYLFVAEQDDEILGFIDYAIQPEPGKGILIAVINYFYVVPELRNTDISGSLWKTAIESARNNNAKEFSSICFPDKINFWEKHGFKKQFYGIRKVI